MAGLRACCLRGRGDTHSVWRMRKVGGRLEVVILGSMAMNCEMASVPPTSTVGLPKRDVLNTGPYFSARLCTNAGASLM